MILINWFMILINVSFPPQNTRSRARPRRMGPVASRIGAPVRNVASSTLLATPAITPAIWRARITSWPLLMNKLPSSSISSRYAQTLPMLALLRWGKWFAANTSFAQMGWVICSTIFWRNLNSRRLAILLLLNQDNYSIYHNTQTEDAKIPEYLLGSWVLEYSSNNWKHHWRSWRVDIIRNLKDIIFVKRVRAEVVDN